MFQNSEGKTVDPVPFCVVTGMAFLGSYSFFPVYFLSFGVPTPVALVITTGIFSVLAVCAYSRFVWNARPEIRREVSAGLRLEKMFYYALVVTGLFLLLTLVTMAQ